MFGEINSNLDPLKTLNNCLFLGGRRLPPGAAQFFHAINQTNRCARLNPLARRLNQ